MKKKKKSPQAEAMAKWNVANAKFSAFVDKKRAEMYECLEKREIDNGNQVTDMLIGGIPTFMEYLKQNKEFSLSFNLFITTYAKICDGYDDRQSRIEELWRLIFSLRVAREISGIEESNVDYQLAEASVIFYLYRYLWEDYEKYCKDNNLELR